MFTQKFDTASPVSLFITDEEAGRLILNNTHDAYMLLNPQLYVVYCNQFAREGIKNFLGIEIFPGFQILDLVKEERKAPLRKIYDEVLQGKTFTTEQHFYNKDGSSVYFENTYRPAYNEELQIMGVIVVSKNITEKKNVQKAIQDSEERMQFALEAARQGVWDWNLITNEVIFSTSYKKMYGFEANDLKNDVSEWQSRIHPDDLNKMQASVQEHLNSRNPVYDSQYRIKAKDGCYRWVMAKGRLVSFDENGKPLRMIGTHTDVTDKIEKELELKRMNERFDSMMKATHELLWEWDIASNQFYRAPDSVRNVYGVADASCLVQIDGWLQRLHPEDRTKVKALLDATQHAPHQHTFEMEYRFLRDNGDYAFIYDRGILLRDDQNNPARIIGAAQDISERKRLEKELLRNELEYQRLIHQATVDSQEKERAEIGKELHDNVNQVLTTTKLYLDLALTNNELKEELLQKSLVNINNVIQEIRHLSRSLMDPSIGDLGLIDSMKDLVANIHLTQKIKIAFSADNAVESILDSNQKLTVFRIVQESLNNVLRHAGATQVIITMRCDKNYLVVEISDNGIGFQPQMVKKGAGLKNIQNRVYLIHGSLQLHSEPDQGSRIKIQIPIKNTN